MFGGINRYFAPAPRDSYSPLLFQKILRNYQSVGTLKPARPNHHVKQAQIKQKGDPQKVLIDLNKKVKLVRGREIEEANKQNIRDNTTQYEHSGSFPKRHSDISLGECLVHDRTLGLDEVKVGCNDQQSFEQPKPDELIEENRNIDLNQRIVPSSVCEQFFQASLIGNFRPETLPFNQLPSSLLTFNQKDVDEESESPQKGQRNVLKQPSQDCQQISATATAKKEISQKPQIKTKISVRILKKRLQNCSLLEVAEDLIRHHRIEFDEPHSQPDKQIICEALLSLMKVDLIR